MPRNQRPSGLFGEFDYGWEGTTLSERIQAQNQWDLLEAQEKANKLAQEKLDLEKAKYKNYLEQNEQLQEQAKIIQEEESKKKLCENLGISYTDLKEFLLLFNIDKEEIKRQIIAKSIKDGQAVIKGLEEDLKNLKPNTKKLVDKIKQLENENNKLSKSIISKVLNKSKIEDNKMVIDAIKTQIKKVEHEFESSKDDIELEIKNKIENCTANIKELQDYLDKPNNERTVKQDFEEFRRSHYNKDIELLFKRLNIELPKLEVSQDTGTVEDYKEYFKTKILEN